MAVPSGFFEALIRKRGLTVTPKRLALFNEWQRWEGMPEWTFNPLATTQPGRRSAQDIGHGPGKWNNANPPLGVGIYADLNAGVEATYETLTNGHYPAILASIDAERITDRAAFAANVRTWGTTGFAGVVAGGWEIPGAEHQAAVSVISMLVAINGGHLAHRKDGTEVRGIEAIEDQYARGNSWPLAFEAQQTQLAQLAFIVANPFGSKPEQVAEALAKFIQQALPK